MVGYLLGACQDVGEFGEGPPAAAGSLDRDRRQRTIFVSGERGAGKSTVLLSLLALLERERGTPVNMQEGGVPPDIRRQLQSQCVPLPPLDLEIVPDTSNLLLALLTRIDQACEDRIAGHAGSDADPALGSEYSARGVSRFTELVRDVSFSWEGLNAAIPLAPDPDTRAADARRFEIARYHLNRFDLALADLARSLVRGRGAAAPVFVLPIDDIDLNPRRAVELFHLFRLVSARNLVFVAAGSQEAILHALRCDSLADLASPLRGVQPPLLTKAFIARLSTDAESLAYERVRKYIPVAQRVHVRALTADEALTFRRLGREGEPTLLDRMDQFLVDVSPTRVQGKHVPREPLANLFVRKPSPETWQGPPTLSGCADTLAARPREILDLYSLLEPGRGHPALSLLEHVERDAAAQLAASDMTDSVRALVQRSLEYRDALPPRTSPYRGVWFEQRASGGKIVREIRTGGRATARFKELRASALEVHRASGGVPIEPRLQAWLYLREELLLRVAGDDTPGPLPPFDFRHFAWSTAVPGALTAWAYPRFVSPLDVDDFRVVWNSGLAWLGRESVGAVDDFARLWILAGTAALCAGSLDALSDIPLGLGRSWSELAEDVAAALAPLGERGRYSNGQREWIGQIFEVLAPERAVSPAAAAAFLGTDLLRELDRRGLRRQRAFRLFGSTETLHHSLKAATEALKRWRPLLDAAAIADHPFESGQAPGLRFSAVVDEAIRIVNGVYETELSLEAL